MSCFSGRMNEYRKVSLDRFDGNNLKSTIYFLSHCHEDHTQGLEKDIFFERLKSRTDVFLYCSQVTKILLLENKKYGHLESFIKTIEVEVPTTIPIPDLASNKVENVTVTLLHAAHCPGSVMFLFEGSEGTVLYTGDFRWESKHVSKVEALHSGKGVKQIESLYIDTTFCHPSSLYIPYRQDCANAVYSMVKEWIAKGGNYMVHFTPRSTYGHEHLLKDVAERTGFKIHVSPWKASIYRQIPELKDVFTEYGDETPIHSCYGERYSKDRTKLPCGYKSESHDKLNVMVILPSTMYFTKKVHLDLTHIVEKKGGIYRVCYSFHSSMIEVRDLVTYLQPRRVRPNVKPMDDKTLSDVQIRLNEFLKMKHRRQVSEEFAIKPLGTLKKSRFTRKRQLSVASDDSDNLVFNSPDEKRQKVSIISPCKTSNGAIDKEDSDQEDGHSSYAGSHGNSDSELSGLCELDEEDQLSTPAQSFLDAIDSQCSQESSEGSTSNSLSYRVCRSEDNEQTVGNAPEEEVLEEEQEEITKEEQASSKQEKEQSTDSDNKNLEFHEDHADNGKSGQCCGQGKCKSENFDCVLDSGKDDRVINQPESKKEIEKFEEADMREVKSTADENGSGNALSENISCSDDPSQSCLPKIQDKKFYRSNKIEKSTKFEKNGSFDLFDSSGSLDGIEAIDDCEVAGRQDVQTSSEKNDEIENGENHVDASKSKVHCELDIISDGVDSRPSEAIAEVDIHSDNHAFERRPRKKNDEIMLIGKHEAARILNQIKGDGDMDDNGNHRDNQSTKSSQGFVVSVLNDEEIDSDEDDKDEIVMVGDESDDDDKSRDKRKLLLNNKSKHDGLVLTRDFSVGVQNEINSKNCIQIYDSDDDNCDEMHSTKKFWDEIQSSDSSDSDETLPPSQNSIFNCNAAVCDKAEKGMTDNTEGDVDLLFVSADFKVNFNSSPNKENCSKAQNTPKSNEVKYRNLATDDSLDKDKESNIIDEDKSSVIDLTLSDSDLDS